MVFRLVLEIGLRVCQNERVQGFWTVSGEIAARSPGKRIMRRAWGEVWVSWEMFEISFLGSEIGIPVNTCWIINKRSGSKGHSSQCCVNVKALEGDGAGYTLPSHPLTV